MMKLEDIHARQTEIRDSDHLESLLLQTPSVDGYEAFMMHTIVGEPELWLYFNNGISYTHFFRTTDGSHPGYQPLSEYRPEHGGLPETITFLQVGASWADRIEMPKQTTVSKGTAIAIAREFFESRQLPKCIAWFEL